jgi:hypothetical protein
MNNLIYLQSSFNSVNPGDNNAKKELLNFIDSPDHAVVNTTLHLSEDFSLSDYEDDDDDSGFCCPCCLPR